MNHEQTKPEVEFLVKERRREIISSIATTGLIPGRDLEEGDQDVLIAADIMGSDEVLGNIVHPNATIDDIERLLYSTEESIFTVVTERNDTIISRPNTPQEVTQRAEASALIIAPDSRLKKRYPNFSRAITRDDFNSEKTRTEVVGIPTIVEPESFSHIVLPLGVWVDVGDLLSGLSAKTTVVKDSVEGQVWDMQAQVPNYLFAIHSLAASATEPYWVHAVRLPTVSNI